MVAATAAATAASGQSSACYKCPEPLSDQVICTAIDLPVPLNLCHIISYCFCKWVYSLVRHWSQLLQYAFCCHGSSETTAIACVQHLPKPGSKGRLCCRGKRAPGQRDNDLQSRLMQCNVANTLDCTEKEIHIMFLITLAATVCLTSTKKGAFSSLKEVSPTML